MVITTVRHQTTSLMTTIRTKWRQMHILIQKNTKAMSLAIFICTFGNNMATLAVSTVMATASLGMTSIIPPSTRKPTMMATAVKEL